MLFSGAGEPNSVVVRRSYLLSHIVERILTSSLVEGLRGALVIVLPNGRRLEIGNHAGNRPVPELYLNNYRVIGTSLRRGSLGFADAYIKGDIECSDLTGLIQFYLRNRTRLHASGGQFFKSRRLDRVAHLLRHNSLKGSRRNISEHYDLGNAFYQHWLDRTMTYSGGLYRDGATTLEAAQLAKLDRVRALLSAKEERLILEIGCGWGSFACRTAQLDKTRVIGLTLSHQQLSYAKNRAAETGLDQRCRFHHQDYRNTVGQYDHIVSIEMIEAVGEAYWGQYFQKLHGCLKPDGTAVIQAITIKPELFETYRRKTDFIQRYIFPGGMLPTDAVIASQARRVGFAIDHTENFGSCYAETLRAWRARFEMAWPEISKLGFDDHFRRRWLYYLMYCEAGFDSQAIDVGLYRLRK